MTCQPNLLAIRVTDLERAERFYGALGHVFERHRHGRGPLHSSSVSDGFVFELYPLEPGQTPTSSVRVGFAVPDVDRASERACAAGGAVVAAPRASPWGRRAVIRDPDGHRVELLALSLSPAPP